MSQPAGRSHSLSTVTLAEGLELQRVTPASRLYGANGLRTGPDGRLYVAQVSGSQISAIDVTSGAVTTVSPMGGAIVAPDDLAFDEQGNLFATEISEGRVSMRSPRGDTRVVYGDLPCANPITIHQGRLFAGECRHEGRIMELSLGGGAPRTLVENVPMPNAMEVGPDGKLYFPVMEANEIWRIGLDGGAPEVVARNLGVPDSVKFDAGGFIVSTQAATGQVLRINPATGEQQVLAQLAPGLDNLSFVDGRLFVSSFSGEITEVLAGGQTRSLLPAGMNGPMGLTCDELGRLVIADGPYCYSLQPGGEPQVLGMLFTPGSPGYSRGVAAAGAGEFIVTTGLGQVARWNPVDQTSEFLAQGLDRLYGVAVDGRDAVVVAEAGRGRLLGIAGGSVTELATGLNQPKGVAITVEGDYLVAEEGAGRVVKAVRGGVDIVLDGLQRPQGIAVAGDLLYVVDAGSRSLIEFNRVSGACRTLAAGLPVGAPEGITPKPINPFPPLSGAMGPFADLAVASDGTLFIGADAEGSVLCLGSVS
ncbi:SMP-30/gluconolactonase/LRE family protein [Pseudomaricurvus sp. HS19]|uniref:SMP-30/gluconolactonase/LRE family protein n=1 Tax=Pseudomaricurvus sp. HS19 TaxID=2692626 RepID=UPI00136D7943|nr:SMP-30/gluconolactonase/LRE family protein [Pseudomaricurvus sp. HS19]MYM61922.1 gluconolaconase [Pseudomaricurvus sp. HS19]